MFCFLPRVGYSGASWLTPSHPMDKSLDTKHVWKFSRAGGLDQARFETADDQARLPANAHRTLKDSYEDTAAGRWMAAMLILVMLGTAAWLIRDYWWWRITTGTPPAPAAAPAATAPAAAITPPAAKPMSP